MTQEREKRWLFDEEKADELLAGLAEGWYYSADVKKFIQSEIERNRKEAVRDFAEKIKPRISYGTPGENYPMTVENIGRNDLAFQVRSNIEAALKEMGIE